MSTFPLSAEWTPQHHVDHKEYGGTGHQVRPEQHRPRDRLLRRRKHLRRLWIVTAAGDLGNRAKQPLIGRPGPQLVGKYGFKEAKKAVDMVQANALAIHLNALQEAVQPEGDTNYSNLLQKICKLAQELDVPVVVKETGAGIAAEDAAMLEAAGVAGIDVAGVGGTSWAAVEYYRAKTRRMVLANDWAKLSGIGACLQQ